MEKVGLPDTAALGPPLHCNSDCHRGGIGRRAWFRSMYRQRCGGSSPFDGTKRNVSRVVLAVEAVEEDSSHSWEGRNYSPADEILARSALWVIRRLLFLRLARVADSSGRLR